MTKACFWWWTWLNSNKKWRRIYLTRVDLGSSFTCFTSNLHKQCTVSKVQVERDPFMGVCGSRWSIDSNFLNYLARVIEIYESLETRLRFLNSLGKVQSSLSLMALSLRKLGWYVLRHYGRREQRSNRQRIYLSLSVLGVNLNSKHARWGVDFLSTTIKNKNFKPACVPYKNIIRINK